MSADGFDRRLSRPLSLAAPLTAGSVAFIVIGILTWLLVRHHRRRTIVPASDELH
jgi:hypothetical protein